MPNLMPNTAMPSANEITFMRLQSRYERAQRVAGFNIHRRAIGRVLISEGSGWSSASLAHYLSTPKTTVRDSLGVMDRAEVIFRGDNGWEMTEYGVLIIFRIQRESVAIAHGNQLGFSAELLAYLRSEGQERFDVQKGAETLTFPKTTGGIVNF